MERRDIELSNYGKLDLKLPKLRALFAFGRAEGESTRKSIPRLYM